MDPRQRLRLRLAGVACATCRRPYRGDEVRILAQRDSLAFVRLACAGCGRERLSLITDAPGEDSPGDELVGEALARESDGPGRSPVGEGPGARSRPVRPEDVAAMHAFLAGYQGDLRGLVGDDRGPGPARR